MAVAAGIGNVKARANGSRDVTNIVYVPTKMTGTGAQGAHVRRAVTIGATANTMQWRGRVVAARLPLSIQTA